MKIQSRRKIKFALLITAFFSLQAFLILFFFCKKENQESSNLLKRPEYKWDSISNRIFSEDVRLDEIELNGELLQGVFYENSDFSGNIFYKFWLIDAQRQVVVEVQEGFVKSVGF